MKTLVRMAVSLLVVAGSQAVQAQPCVPAARPIFSQAWDALANVHLDEARALFTQTIAVDPRCTLAWAHLGALTPGPAGARMLEDAREASTSAPRDEQLTVQALAALHDGEATAAVEALRKAHELAPRSYELAFMLAQRLAALERYSEAVEAAQQATHLDPGRGPAWNVLGYALLGQHRPEAAAAFARYAQNSPQEPNAHDSLGDALLVNGQLDEARAAYQRALERSGDAFWPSLHGEATVCAMQGDWFGARAAIEKARRLAVQQTDRVGLMAWTAWSYLADGHPDEAARAVDEFEQDARHFFLEDRVVEARLLRARLLNAQGRYRDAARAFEQLGAPKAGVLSDAQRVLVEATRLHGLVLARARLGETAEAEQQLARLRLVTPRNAEVHVRDLLAHATGLAAIAKRQAKVALEALGQCSAAASACRLELATAQGLTDPAAAQRTLAALAREGRRDPEAWWVRARAVKALESDKPPAW